MGAEPKTASPILKRVTSLPTPITVPEKSLPMARGKLFPVTIFSAPLRTFQSIGLMAANLTLTATSPGPGFFSSKSSSFIVSGPP
jgi:hypothetical protein